MGTESNWTKRKRRGRGTPLDARKATATADISGRLAKRYVWTSFFFVALHACFMLCRYGRLPIAPVLGDEVIINDAVVSLAHGQGYVASSFGGSKYHLDRMFAHFPPLYGYVESLAFRAFGVNVYALRATTTVMSLASTVVLALLVYQLCRRELLHWETGLLLNALYCTSVGLITLERVARVESLIGLLTLLAVTAIFVGATRPEGRSGGPAVLVAGAFGALAVAVHPEALTALVLLAPLMFFLVPSRTPMRWMALALFVVLPVVGGLLIYGRQAPAALRQMAAIARDSGTLGTGLSWFRTAIEDHTRTVLNGTVFLLSIMFLLAIALAAYVRQSGQEVRGAFRPRLAACVAASAVVILALMLFVFQMNVRRCQFLLGPLLLLDALCLLGPRPPKQWERVLAWTLTGLQCAGVLAYLSQKLHEPTATDPQRYLALVRSLPAGASVAASPQLWLDFRQAGRPFTVLLLGLGEGAWDYNSGNPLTRFDIILLDRSYADALPVYRVDAEEGRTKTSYAVGKDVIDVYTRK